LIYSNTLGINGYFTEFIFPYKKYLTPVFRGTSVIGNYALIKFHRRQKTGMGYVGSLKEILAWKFECRDNLIGLCPNE